MLTERLYYADSYTRIFTARVIERLTLDNRPGLVLDKTYFYPTSGGQPADRGRMEAAQVVDVVVRDGDGAVLHLLDQPLDRAEVSCEIDWARRFDHMQQHTGQHLLSQAFLRAAEAETVGFHLGAEAVTIDLAAERLAPAAVDRAEEIANDAVTADLPVRAWFPAPAELPRLPLRHAPEVDGPLRVVAIGDFDFTACGGTHVARTGQVGLVKILKVDREKKGLRVEFRCGHRAFTDYRRKSAIVQQLAAEFTCGQWEVDRAVARLRDEARALQHDLRAARESLQGYEAQELAAAARSVEGRSVIRRAWLDRDAGELRQLAARLTARPGTVALLGSAGAKAQLVFARAGDVDRDMRLALRSALAVLKSQRGGGSAALAQGGGVEADLRLLEQALQQAEHDLFNP